MTWLPHWPGKGIHVFAQHGVDEKTHKEELYSLLSCYPDVVLDDGADICMALHERPEYGKNLKGISEETTTGVTRLQRLADAKKLLFPAITVNEAKSKHMFDNRYGTGQSTWTAITHLTNMTVGGQKIVILGYGWVGRGVATIARGMGGHIIITEPDPWKALEAVMDGYEVMPIKDACIDRRYLYHHNGTRFRTHEGTHARDETGGNNRECGSRRYRN
jgi:adenosylhomocysteinase